VRRNKNLTILLVFLSKKKRTIYSTSLIMLYALKKQGYYSPCTRCIDGMDKECPQCCLCIESVCCCSCSISATRMMVMDMYELHSDPCDRKLIRINNMLQCLSCICDIAAMCDPELRECAQCLDCISDIFYCMIQSCMVTQVSISHLPSLSLPLF
jgi:hypothetical protein